MPGQRGFGMDHPHHPWSPIVKRPPLRWPKEARVAVCVIVNLEHMEWKTGEGSYWRRELSGGFGNRRFPDYTRKTHREYGHRVGIFRVLDALEAVGMRPTIAMDLMTAQNYPFLVEHCLGRGAEIVAHGVSVTQMITSEMGEDEERKYIARCLAGMREATGETPKGWLGPEFGESAKTPQLLAEAGVEYVCDWTNDEQPYEMTTPTGSLASLPICLDLDDVNALWERRMDVERYAQLVKESVDRLLEDGKTTGRLLVLNLRPWLMGQPFRIGYLEDVLEHLASREGVWAATGSEIVEGFREAAGK